MTAGIRSTNHLFSLLVLLTLFFNPLVIASERLLWIPNFKSEKESKISIPVLLVGGQSISAIAFTVLYDSSSVSIASSSEVTKGSLLAKHSLGTALGNGFVRVTIASAGRVHLPGTAGTLLQITFKTAKNASGLTKVRLSDIAASDELGNPVSLVRTDGSILFQNGGNSPPDGMNELVFPQVANGSYSGGKYLTQLIFVNVSDQGSTARVRFYKSDGSPLTVKLKGGQQGAEFLLDSPQYGTVFMETAGTGSLSVGYARVSCDSLLGGTLLFSAQDNQGKVLTEAAVGSSLAVTQFSIPITFIKGRENTGIAIVNLSEETVSLELSLHRRNGVVESVTFLSLGPGQHLPKFATELFPLLLDTSGFKGSIEVIANGTISAVALKQRGSLLTTFPVIMK